MGYKSWWIDAGVIASGSADKAAEGNHYYRSMRLHKETFNALIHFRAESLTSNFTMMNVELLSQLQSLQRQPNAENLKVILDSNSFKQLFEQIITLCEGTESRMMIAYLRDVSSLLALVSAVREADFEHHLQAERDMIKQCFAFNHVNYVHGKSLKMTLWKFSNATTRRLTRVWSCILALMILMSWLFPGTLMISFYLYMPSASSSLPVNGS